MSRRRRVGSIVVIGSVAAVLVLFFEWPRPSLSVAEGQLVGTWEAPEFDARAAWVSAKGPVTHSRHVWQLGRDRSSRLSIASADDPTLSLPIREGLWSAEPGRIHLEGFGKLGDALREARERIRITLGGPYLGRTSGRVSHPVRFIDADTWELTPPGGRPIVWRRRP